MKTHEELRVMAAHLEIRQLRETQGIECHMQLKLGQRNGIPKRNVPVLFSGADLQAYDRATAAHTRDPRNPAPDDPMPVRDFEAWTYSPRCPKCAGRQIHVKGFNDGVAPTDTTPAHCLRPVTGSPKRDCGWKGTNVEVSRQCLTCGDSRSHVVDGECAFCKGLGEELALLAMETLRDSGWIPDGSLDYRLSLVHEVAVGTGPEPAVFRTQRVISLIVVAALISGSGVGELRKTLAGLRDQCEADIGEGIAQLQAEIDNADHHGLPT